MENNKSRRNRKNRRNRRKKVTLIVAVIVILGIGFGGYEIFSHKEYTVKATASEGQVSDNTAKQEEEKPKPTDIMPGQNIIYSADSYAVPANEVFQMLKSSKPVNNKKEVFLTFDDGPSDNTEAILKILKEEDVHATFFVLGSQIEENSKNKELLKEEIDSGNAIGNHTISHSLHKLYPGNSVNVDVFMKEINKNDEMMKEIIGKNFDTKVIRMPGGYISREYYKDPHLKALDAAFAKQDMYSIDWDAETGDAESNSYTPDYLISRAKHDMKNDNHVVLLMHDAAAKKSTVKALPQIIKMFKDNGYEFKVIKNAPEKDTDNKDTSSNK